MDALNLEKVHYVGESVGGVLGVPFAVRYPHRLHSLTLCATPIALPNDKLQASTGFSDPTSGLMSISLAEFAKRSMQSGALTVTSPEHEEWALGEWEKNHKHVLAGLISMFNHVNISSLLPQVNVPTLLLSPVNSLLTSIEQQKEISNLLPNARIRYISGAGHEIYVDEYMDCISELKKFISNLLDDSASFRQV